MREQGIRGNEYLHGKEKLKKKEYQVRKQGIRGNEFLTWQGEAEEGGIAGEEKGNNRESTLTRQ